MFQQWKKIRFRLELGTAHILAWILPRLPRNGLLALANFLADLVCALDPRGRAVALANLEIAFGDRYLPGEKRDIVFRCYRNLARTFFDLFWIAGQSAQVARSLVDVVGWQEFKAGEKNGSGRMFAGCHLGNFEMLPVVLGLLEMPNLAIGQDINNPAITPFFVEARSKYGNELIPRERAALRMLKALKRGRNCGFLVDLTLKLDEPGHLIECFGRKKWVTGVHVALAALTEARLLPVVCLPIENGRYEFRFLPELKFSEGISEQEMTQRCWDQFELLIRERPECWLWNYKHWRYQPEGAADYPFYAHSGKKFQKLLTVTPQMER